MQTDEKVLDRLNEHDKALVACDHEIGSLKHRMDDCEEQQKQYGSLIRSVDKLANNMEHMLQEQKSQGERLERLEQTPVKNYEHYKQLIIGCIITRIIGLIMGAIFALIFK